MSDRIIQSTDFHGNKYDVPVAELKWRPSAYGIVVRDNKILLISVEGKYNLPGGGLDFGETPEQAVIREVKEETGFDVSDPQLVGSLSKFFTLNHNSKGEEELAHVQTILMYYVCTLAGGDASQASQEMDEKQYGLDVEWVDVSKVDSLPIAGTMNWQSVVTRALGL